MIFQASFSVVTSYFWAHFFPLKFRIVMKNTWFNFNFCRENSTEFSTKGLKYSVCYVEELKMIFQVNFRQLLPLSWPLFFIAKHDLILFFCDMKFLRCLAPKDWNTPFVILRSWRWCSRLNFSVVTPSFLANFLSFNYRVIKTWKELDFVLNFYGNIPHCSAPNDWKTLIL